MHIVMGGARSIGSNHPGERQAEIVRGSRVDTKALIEVHGGAKIEYIPFPADLNERYQHFTEADLSGLRETGCDLEFTRLEEGIRETFAMAEGRAAPR